MAKATMRLGKTPGKGGAIVLYGGFLDLGLPARHTHSDPALPFRVTVMKKHRDHTQERKPGGAGLHTI